MTGGVTSTLGFILLFGPAVFAEDEVLLLKNVLEIVGPPPITAVLDPNNADVPVAPPSLIN